MAPLKVLVCGDVEGKFKQYFTRIENVNKKNGPFDLLLCVGSFFSEQSLEWEQYRSGKLKVPLPIYILGPACPETTKFYPDAKGSEICPNVTYLGKQGILTDPSGLRICFLSGSEGKTNHSYCFTQNDVLSLETTVKDSAGVDLLVTSGWPRGVWNYAGKPADIQDEETGSKLISHLAYTIRPRYHFCGSLGSFYERLPYRNHVVLSEGARHITRFIALAKVGNPEKKRWLYAFTITPMANMKREELVMQTPDVTENPYSANITQLLQIEENAPKTQFFYDMNSRGDDGPRKKKRKEGEKQPQGPCWFCLSSPQVEKHLIISIGEEMYVALAKGGLVPSHLLILPVNHTQASVDLPDEAVEELEKFKFAIKRCFDKEDEVPVFFERNYKTNHMQIQVVPVPKSCRGRLKKAFTELGASKGIELQELPSRAELSQLAPSGTPFFFVELPSGERLYARIKGQFPINFGREVVCCPGILDMTDRVDWRECKMSEKEETVTANKFRRSFEEFDFTMDE